jgi:hypothetical protein
MYLQHICGVVAACFGKPAARLAAETVATTEEFFALPAHRPLL